MKPVSIFGFLAFAVLGAVTAPLVTGTRPSARPQQAVPVRLVDLPLNRAVSTVLSVTPGVPSMCPFPPSHGFAITLIAGIPHNPEFVSGGGDQCPTRLRIGVDGTTVASVRIKATLGGFHEFDPPLLVRPGQTLTISFHNPTPGGNCPQNLPHPIVGNDAAEFTVSGWLLLPGEL